MQTILGAGGAIGIELAKALKQFTKNIRLVSRSPKAVNSGDQLLSADLTKPEDVIRAVKGSNIVYLTVGLPYNTKLWQSTWPKIMENVISACKQENAKLVFFDNVYMYDPNYLDHMTEETPISPVSKKGLVRTHIANMLMDETKKGSLQALIARSADFYGPSIKNTSVLTETVFNNLSKGEKALWFASVNYKHSYTYTPDAGKATALLGNTPDAYNQVWHLPTAANPFTGKEWIEAIAKEMNVEPKYQILSKFMLRLIGIFKPVMKEMIEMFYQYDRNYVFDSSKFENHFDFKPTPYMEGIRDIVNKDYR
ncbi:MAG: NAD-dependent epimerase/dehydratase family protein [Calditrichaeota bacterium]|nr:MAG: NAD-dependent epimerase/dehydratase family protein [Calditrichota bacterium]